MVPISIKIDNLTVAFENGKPVLNNINLEISEGEFVLVLGPSGGGKSVFSQCLNGIIPQVINVEEYTGKISVFGKDPAETSVAEMATLVGLVFQDPDAQLCSLCVEDEIVFGMENLKFPRELIRERLEYALEMVGLQDHRDAHTWGLSGGQKQRLAIASVIAMQPKIIVLDEPTSNLDPQGAKEVVKILKKIQQDTNITIIAIDHRVDDLMDTVDRLLIFENGEITYNGDPRRIMEEHGGELFKLGVNIPQVVELALGCPPHLQDSSQLFPINVAEAAKRFSPLKETINTPVLEEKKTKGEPIIKFENVTAGYARRPNVLKNINLDIYKQDFIAIIGQNGAGKTTLTKLLIGLQQPSEGVVKVFGQNVEKMNITRLTEKVGYVFQYPDNQLVTDTVYDEVAYSLRLRGVDPEEVDRKVKKALEEVNLIHLIDRHPLTLSMGEKRVLSIATMLILDQDVLIMDEPTMGLDNGVLHSIMGVCQELNKQGKTIIMVTHDMRCVAQWASRVLVMEQGNIIFDGLPREFFQMKAILDKNHLGKPPICELSELLWPEWNYTFLSQEEMLAAVEEAGAKSAVV